MVYLVKEVSYLKNKLLSAFIPSALYYYLFDKNMLINYNFDSLGEVDFIALKGYKNIEPTEEEINNLLVSNKGPIRFTDNIYSLIGIYLADRKKIIEFLTEKFKKSEIKFQYLLCLIFNDFKKELEAILNKSYIEASEEIYFRIIKILITDESIQEEHFVLIKSIIEKASDIADLIIIEKILEKLIQHDIKILNRNPKDTIISVLNNFDNAIRRITQHRREGKEVFKIKDEYDVQDLLYLMLKPIFEQLEIEDPSPKIGGKSNRIDLVIPKYGLLIEVKMLKEKDDNERKFINELKEDFESYYSYPNIKDLIVFIYDPYRKTIDKNNFYSLRGERKKINIVFNVEIILI